MVLLGVPLILEDRTGLNHSTEYDDIYDRMFIGVASSSSTETTSAPPKDAPYSLKIYTLDRRSSNRGFATPHATTQMFAGHDPSVVLDFGPGGALGNVVFVKRGTREMMKVAMGQWVRKVGGAGGGPTRKLRASDNEEYTWTYKPSDDAEWSCTNASGYVVATYSLKPPGEPVYRSSSGNALTVYEAYAHLAVELLASLTIMRHIRQHNL